MPLKTITINTDTHKVVPLEPTDYMIKEGTMATMTAMFSGVVKDQINGMVSQMTFSCVPEYKAMLSVAPEFEGEKNE